MTAAARGFAAGWLGRALLAVVVLFAAVAFLRAYSGWIFLGCAVVAGWRLWRFAEGGAAAGRASGPTGVPSPARPSSRHRSDRYPTSWPSWTPWWVWAA